MTVGKSLNEKVLHYLNIYSKNLRKSKASSTLSFWHLMGLTIRVHPGTVDCFIK